MFVLPALTSIGLDTSAILLALHPFANVYTAQTVAALAAARLVLFLPLVWAFYHQRKVPTLLPLLWEAGNLVFLVVQGSMFAKLGLQWGAEWILLCVSSGSVACQTMCIVHLRSSAAPHVLKKHVFLRSAVRAMGGGEAFGQRGRSHSMDDDDKSNARAYRHASGAEGENGRFLSDWGEKMSQMQERWGEKLDRLVERLEGFGRSPSELADPLPLLVKLFAHQDIFEQLERSYATDPAGFEFLLPQYTLFLLYASFDSSQRLERFLLDKSAQSIHLAHRLYWFLVSFCLSGAGISPVGVDALTQMLRELAERGEAPAALLAEGAGPGESEARVSRGRPPSVEAFGRAGDGSIRPTSTLGPATFGLSGLGGLERLNTLSASRRGGSAQGYFMSAPAFVDALCGIARDLMVVPKERRTEELRRRLRRLDELHLPGKSIYVPVGNRRHRVYRIHAEESFAFSTKDRCPFLVTLEVLDYDRSGFVAGALAAKDSAAAAARKDSDARRRSGSGGGSGGVSGSRSATGLAAWARETPLVRGIQRVASTGFTKTFRLGNREFKVTLGDPDHSPEGQRGFGEANGGGGGGALAGGPSTNRRGSESPSASSVVTDSAAGSPNVDRWQQHSLHRPPYSPNGSIDFSFSNNPRAGSGGAAGGFRPLGGAPSPSASVGEAFAGFSLPPTAPAAAAAAAAAAAGGGRRQQQQGYSSMAQQQETLVSLDALGLGQHAKRLGMWSSPNLRRESVDDMGVSVGRARSIGLDLERLSGLPPGSGAGGGNGINSSGSVNSVRDRALSDPPPPLGLRLMPSTQFNNSAGGNEIGRWGQANNNNNGGGSNSNNAANLNASRGLISLNRDDSMSYTESEVTPSPTPRSLMRRGAAGATFSGYGGYGSYSTLSSEVRRVGSTGRNGLSGSGVTGGDLEAGIGAGATAEDGSSGGGGGSRIPAASAAAAAAAGSGDSGAAAAGSGGGGGGGGSKRRLGFGGISLPFLRNKSSESVLTSVSGAGSGAVAGANSGSGSSAGGGGKSSSAKAPAAASEKAPLLARRSSKRGSGGPASLPPQITAQQQQQQQHHTLTPSSPPALPHDAFRGNSYASPERGRGRRVSSSSGGGALLRTTMLGQESPEDDRVRAYSGASDSSASAAAAVTAAYAPAAAPAAPRVIFREKWRQKEHRLRKLSKVGHLWGWRLVPIIVKSGDDLRQEQVASQLVQQCHRVLMEGQQAKGAQGMQAWLRPYDIIATSPDSGIIEAVPDTVSLDALKKNDPQYTTLADFFDRHFGCDGDAAFLSARTCFLESLAAYSIVTYLLQVKDRHNGNILLDAHGHIIHIDYGFMLANSPGGNFAFESAPFKLTTEFIELMDGPRSECFKQFRQLCVDTFMLLRRQMHKVTLLAEMCSVGNGHLPCFAGRPDRVVDDLRRRFRPDLHDRAAVEFVHDLIDRAARSWHTALYDSYQKCFVGIR